MSARPRCLVTGASGFIGGHVARALAREGIEVRGLVRATSATAGLEGSGVELVTGELGDRASLRAAADGCRYLVHCAAMVSDWGLAGEIARVNVEGTRHVLEAALDAGVTRVVHISSTDVYGYPGGSAVPESHVPGRFRNWYAETKRAAEAEVRRLEASRGLDAVILRPATVYGPGSTAVIGEMGKALRRGHMLLIDGGRAVAGLCYVENLADAVTLALAGQAAGGEAFNVTDGLAITWREFLDDLADGLGVRRARLSLPYPLAAGVAVGLESGYRLLRRASGVTLAPLLSRQAVHVLGIDQGFSHAKARALLGWEPRVGYAAGLRATLDWLRAELG